MSESFEVRVPDIGGVEDVLVAEVLVTTGDRVKAEDSLLTLESDKASMDVPSPRAGKVSQVHVRSGEKVAEGTLIVTLEVEQDGAEEGGRVVAAPPPPAEPPPPPLPLEEANELHERQADLHAEVLVLGAGPGGYTAAFRAADLGKKTVLVERYDDLGGVCLNVGCIPSKALLHVAQVMEEVRGMKAHGLTYSEPEVDLEKLCGFKTSVVRRLTGGLTQLAKRRKVEVVQGTGSFVSSHRLAVRRGEEVAVISFDHAIIAVGSRTIRLPGLPYDDRRLMGSTEALDLEDVPQRLLLVGGGIIGLEMATIYHALGSRVTVVELTSQLMPGTDPDLVKPLERRLRERYEGIYLETRVSAVEAQKKGLRVSFEGAAAPAPTVFDRVLVAVGRRPNGDLVDAGAAGVRVDERGFIPVDAHQRTNVPHIFAIGDVTGGPMLAHKASHEGKVAAEVAAGEKSASDARAIPSIAYTDPEVAWVGLTETEAKEKGIDYATGSFPWAANGRSLGMGRDEGKTKLLFDPETRRLLGAGVVGPHAGDLIAEATLALEMGCDAADLALTIHPHPTLSETVAMSAEAFEGTLTDLYLPKRGPKR